MLFDQQQNDATLFLSFFLSLHQLPNLMYLAYQHSLITGLKFEVFLFQI